MTTATIPTMAEWRLEANSPKYQTRARLLREWELPPHLVEQLNHYFIRDGSADYWQRNLLANNGLIQLKDRLWYPVFQNCTRSELREAGTKRYVGSFRKLPQHQGIVILQPQYPN